MTTPSLLTHLIRDSMFHSREESTREKIMREFNWRRDTFRFSHKKQEASLFPYFG
jgi:hypothetical protein